MNNERIKTDAIADAVEIPSGATHYIEGHNGYREYFRLKNNIIYLWDEGWHTLRDEEIDYISDRMIAI